MSFTTARAELAALSISRLAITGTSSSPNYAHAEKLLRQDALAILDRLEAAYAPLVEAVKGLLEESGDDYSPAVVQLRAAMEGINVTNG